MDIATARKEMARIAKFYATFVEAGNLLDELAGMEDQHIDLRKAIEKAKQELAELEIQCIARRESDEREAAQRRAEAEGHMAERERSYAALIARLQEQHNELTEGIERKTAEYTKAIEEHEAYLASMRAESTQLSERLAILRAKAAQLLEV